MLCWTAFYLLIKWLPLKTWHVSSKPIPKEQDLDMRNRIVSFTHGSLQFFFSGYHYVMIPTECGELNSAYQRNMMLFTMSYFLYDFVAMAFEGLLDQAMTLHHSVCMYAIFVSVYENLSGNIALNTFFAAEISNPSMHLKHIFRIVGLRYSKAYECAELSFLILYIYGRMYIGSRVCYHSFACSSNNNIFNVMGGALMLQSVYFVTKMVPILRRRYDEILLRKRLGIKNMWFQPLSKADTEKMMLDNKPHKNEGPL